tara:strand:- start:85 stop:606 length:522 start_codon:yes stop_codon:yes gene_type:complete
MINKLKSIFLLFFITACYSPEKIEKNTQNIHDQISSNVEITLTKKGNITAKIQSTTLKKNNETLKLELFDKVRVDLFNESFIQTSLIRSQSAIIDEKKNQIKAFGNVSVESNDGKKLLTDSLLWDNSADKIFTNANLEFITSDTDTLYGKGFESNIDLTNWNILNPKGSINNE